MKKLKNIKQWDTVATAKVSHHRKTIFTFIYLRENISLYF